MQLEMASRVFINYQKPLRTKQTAAMSTYILISAAVLAVLAAKSFLNSGAQPMLIASTSICVVLAIIGFAVGGSLVWAYFRDRIHTVCISEDGVEYDGKLWPWASVISVRCRPVASPSPIHLEIMVNQGFWRTRLMLPVDVPKTSEANPVIGLRQFLEEQYVHIRWW